MSASTASAPTLSSLSMAMKREFLLSSEMLQWSQRAKSILRSLRMTAGASIPSSLNTDMTAEMTSISQWLLSEPRMSASHWMNSR